MPFGGVFNDGAYGSAIHQLRADGVDDSGSIFGSTDSVSREKNASIKRPEPPL